ncbi:MAG: 7-cyano-7-deazaguanine synthase, partial [Candidatus Eisenbacteria sp.]|nr:7-cyano-7-deazaguanine synthase [Candidatus Eisenbacteria bacterium]
MRALVLLSGGLDSILAVRLLLEQGIEVIGITFVSSFFDAEKAEKSAREAGIELVTIDIG